MAFGSKRRYNSRSKAKQKPCRRTQNGLNRFRIWNSTDKARRIVAFKRIAERHGMSVSQLFKKIADGALEAVLTADGTTYHKPRK